MNWAEMVRRACRAAKFLAALIAVCSFFGAVYSLYDDWPTDLDAVTKSSIYGQGAKTLEEAVTITRKELQKHAIQQAAAISFAGLCVAAVIASTSWIVSGLASPRRQQP